MGPRNQAFGVTMRRPARAAIAAVLVVVAAIAGTVEAAGTSALEVREIRLDPVGGPRCSGTAVVHNPTTSRRTLVINAQSRSAIAGSRPGWGKDFEYTLEPGQTKSCGFLFRFYAPVNDESSLRLRFSNTSETGGRESGGYFLEKTFTGKELERRKAVEPTSVPDDVAAEVQAEFERVKGLLASGDVESFWNSLTEAHRTVGWLGAMERFEKDMRQARSPLSWARREFLELEATGAAQEDAVVVVSASRGKETWRIGFVKEDGGWRMDYVEGYRAAILDWATWQERVLPTMRKRPTKHFDVYFFPGSSAERDIDRIATERDRLVGEMAEFGLRASSRVTLVFFEDGETKFQETGHRGTGWAYGNTIVEVYNDKERVEPRHEMTHIFAGQLGRPPAALSEGLAVYMQEGHTWDGEEVDTTTARLVADGRFVPLSELIKRGEIGAKDEDGEVAYPEAGSFVKFVADRHGKQTIVKLYKELKSPGSDENNTRNVRVLEEALGKDIDAIEAEWKAAVTGG